jgi:hypothetical protein
MSALTQVVATRVITSKDCKVDRILDLFMRSFQELAANYSLEKEGVDCACL